MGMTTHIIGLAPPDDKYIAMHDCWRACKKANIPIPAEVIDFFNGGNPEEYGYSINIENIDGACHIYNQNSSEGYDIILSKLPDKIKIIRFYNSW